MATNGKLTAKDYKTDQEVRWCPGCGDYAILAALQSFMPELAVPKEKIVFVSGIGCAARFPYYMETYGMHSIHGRAPAIATGLSTSRPDLSVWVVTGDGDALSIGGNHLIHALRRNVNLKILLFNNRIYGLTKGQYSPTSQLGMVTRSTPMGSLDYPFNPLSIAIGAEASFVARAIDTDKKGLCEVLEAAARHRGSAFVEILQNCNIYNDGAFDYVREEKQNRIYLRHDERIRFGAEREKGVQQYPDGSLRVVDVAEAGENSLLVHDAGHVQASLAFALSRITYDTDGAVPLGVFRRIERPVYLCLAGIAGLDELGGRHRLRGQEQKRLDRPLELGHSATSTSIGPNSFFCVQVASPRLCISSSANRVTAWVSRSSSANASSKSKRPRRPSRSRSRASRRSSETVGRMWLVSGAGGVRSRSPIASGRRAGSYTWVAASSEARRSSGGSGADRYR